MPTTDLRGGGGGLSETPGRFLGERLVELFGIPRAPGVACCPPQVSEPAQPRVLPDFPDQHVRASLKLTLRDMLRLHPAWVLAHEPDIRIATTVTFVLSSAVVAEPHGVAPRRSKMEGSASAAQAGVLAPEARIYLWIGAHRPNGLSTAWRFLQKTLFVRSERQSRSGETARRLAEVWRFRRYDILRRVTTYLKKRSSGHRNCLRSSRI